MPFNRFFTLENVGIKKKFAQIDQFMAEELKKPILGQF